MSTDRSKPGAIAKARESSRGCAQSQGVHGLSGQAEVLRATESALVSPEFARDGIAGAPDTSGFPSMGGCLGPLHQTEVRDFGKGAGEASLYGVGSPVKGRGCNVFGRVGFHGTPGAEYGGEQSTCGPDTHSGPPSVAEVRSAENVVAFLFDRVRFGAVAEPAVLDGVGGNQAQAEEVP